MILLKLRLPLGLWVAAILLMGCNVTADEKTVSKASAPDNMQSLAWVDSADADKDAKRAISEKDYRLYVVAGRGERLVGIDVAESSELKLRCGIQYIKGGTDVIRDGQHRAALKKAYDYAEKYNQIIVKHCAN